MKASVVILNYNGGKVTMDCLDSLRKNKPESIEVSIIVVDNASKDGPVDEIKEKYPEIVFIKNEENLGFTGGCNTGMKYALEDGADYVILLNNDTVVDKDLVQNLVKGAGDDSVGGVVPKIYFAKGYEFHKDRYESRDLGKVIWYAGGKMDWANLIGHNIGVDEVDNGQFDKKVETDLATGCCFLIKASVLRKVGLFDDKFFLYYEDADLTQRIKRAGYKIMYEPKAVLWHKNAVSSGGSGSKLQDYYISRNRMLLGMRYAPLRTRLALVRESITILKSGREWQKIGIKDFYLRIFGKGTFFNKQ